MNPAILVALEKGANLPETSRTTISPRGCRKILEGFEEQFMPGCYECPKCGFVRQLNIMYMKSGTIGADTTVADRACPNDGELMVPLTYKRAYAQLSTNCEQQVLRAVKAEAETKALVSAIKSMLDLEMGRGDGAIRDYIEDMRNIVSAALPRRET